MLLTKQQDKTTEKELNETEISNQDNEFKIMVIKMINELGRRVEELSEDFNKGTENIKKDKSELKNIVTKIKNKLERINSRLDVSEE